MTVRVTKEIATRAQTGIKTDFYLSPHGMHEIVSKGLSIGQAADPYGKVKSGSIVAVDSNGAVHPIGRAQARASTTTTSTFKPGLVAAKRFRVGDTVEVFRGDNNASLSSGTRTITAIDPNDGTITFDGATISTDHTRLDYILRASSGSAYGISWGDANNSTGKVDPDTLKAICVDGMPISVLLGGRIKESALVDLDGGGTTIDPAIKAQLVTLGFRFE